MRKRLGTKLEESIEARLKEYDKTTRRTFNSGAVFHDGDIETKNFVIECKDRSTDSITIKKDVWEQIDYQAARRQKDGVLINRNKQGTVLVTISLTTFEWLLEELKEKL